jgi:hypothetical protein
LSARIVASKDSSDLDQILPELRAAIHESSERLRARAFAVLSGRGDFPPRKAQNLLTVLNDLAQGKRKRDVCTLLGRPEATLCVPRRGGGVRLP